MGATGAQGISGVVTVLSYERTNAAVTLPMGSFTPSMCETTPYLAGVSETATVVANVTLFNAAASATVYLAPIYSQNGMGTFYPVSQYAIQTIFAGTSSTFNHQAVVLLTPGVTYRFRTEVRAPAAPLLVEQVFCRGLVTIVKR